MSAKRSALGLAALLALSIAPASPGRATCGGGGGGVVGGMDTDEDIFKVPWRAWKPADAATAQGWVLYWFPSSEEETKKSSLRVSRFLYFQAARCITMQIGADPSLQRKLAGEAPAPLAVLAAADGTVLGKAESVAGFLKVAQLEKLLESEMSRGEDALDRKLDEAGKLASSGDSAGAAQMYRAVYDQKCLFPKKAKKATKGLKGLGIKDVTNLSSPPDVDFARTPAVEAAVRAGLRAERRGDYRGAGKEYSKAHRLDPADPVPLFFLGEVYRHHTGEWAKARSVFERVLAMPADPLSRAVALHGLGKMTIHEGDFAKGRALLEESVKTHPLAVAYRNLAVYWNSEGNAAKADAYVREALALAPQDPYNLVFAAALMAGNGHGDEALKIAGEHRDLLPASYNLAAIYAQTGRRDKALELLKRHFFEYERFQAVRAEEMMEARVDAVFASLRGDADFIALTSGADGMLNAPRKP